MGALIPSFMTPCWLKLRGRSLHSWKSSRVKSLPQRRGDFQKLLLCLAGLATNRRKKDSSQRLQRLHASKHQVLTQNKGKPYYLMTLSVMMTVKSLSVHKSYRVSTGNMLSKRSPTTPTSTLVSWAIRHSNGSTSRRYRPELGKVSLRRLLATAKMNSWRGLIKVSSPINGTWRLSPRSQREYAT